MHNFDLKEMRMGACLFLICLAMFLIVWNAFRYLPSDEENSHQSVSIKTTKQNTHSNNYDIDDNIINRDDYPEEEDYDESDEDAVTRFNKELKQRRQAILERQKRFSETETQEFENNSDEDEDIDEEETEIEAPNSNNSDDLINNAKTQVKENNLEGALQSYKKASEMATSKENQAVCYEQIAMIYGMQKRYGTALAYAQKACLAKSTPARELLVAKLYYKTGDKEKANRKMESIFNKDFVIEN